MDYNLERYPKIAEIKKFILHRGISICTSDDGTKYAHLIAMNLKIKNEQYTVFVDDEYEDLKKKNSLLNFVLVFRELAMIDDSSGFLEWCSQHGLDPNTAKLLAYYKHISSKIEEIKLLFKNNTIDYFISDLDFQLNSGTIQLLRKQ
jgi:hypothetical protein